MASETGIGASVKRKEDARFITGAVLPVDGGKSLSGI